MSDKIIQQEAELELAKFNDYAQSHLASDNQKYLVQMLVDFRNRQLPPYGSTPHPTLQQAGEEIANKMFVRDSHNNRMAKDVIATSPTLQVIVKERDDAVAALDISRETSRQLHEGVIQLKQRVEELENDAKRWKYYCCAQTALYLGTKLDPNNSAIDWAIECNLLADEAMKKGEV
jgi:hypothetical protein